MADYYIHWSVALKLSTEADQQEEETAWLEEALEVPEELFEASVDEVTEHFANLGIDISGIDILDDWPGFEWEFCLDEGHEEEPHLWSYCSDNGNLDVLFAIVQGFLSKFRPDDTFSVEWSYTCSKPRLDAYGGGAALVTATDIHTINTGEWLESKRKELAATLGGAGGAG